MTQSDPPDQLPAVIPSGALTKLTGAHLVPALVADLGEQAAWRYVEFFTANRGDSMTIRGVFLVVTTLLTGCARLEFADGWTPGGAHFHDPVPYLLVAIGKDCATTAALITLPGAAQTVSFHSGYGSANLSANFQNGMLSSIGQQTDTKIPETLTAITGLATAIPKLAAPPPVGPPAAQTCTAKAKLFKIRDGQVDPTPSTQLIVE